MNLRDQEVKMVTVRYAFLATRVFLTLTNPHEGVRAFNDRGPNREPGGKTFLRKIDGTGDPPARRIRRMRGTSPPPAATPVHSPGAGAQADLRPRSNLASGHPTFRTPPLTPSGSWGRRCWPARARTRGCHRDRRRPSASSLRGARPAPPARSASAPAGSRLRGRHQ